MKGFLVGLGVAGLVVASFVYKKPAFLWRFIHHQLDAPGGTVRPS